MGFESISNDIYRISADTNGYLLVRNRRSLLVDCPLAEMETVCRTHELPVPEVILHTQIQEEHCREGDGLAGVSVYVPAGEEDIAARSEVFFRDCRTAWPPSREWEYRGEERYGVAGGVAARPPRAPLAVAGTLTPGESFPWQDLTFDVIALPGSGKHSIGLYLADRGLLFSGDLLWAGGYLVNMYDVDRAYFQPRGYAELRASLQRVVSLAPTRLLPSTGPVSEDPSGDATRLLERTDWIASLPARRHNESRALKGVEPLRVCGRYAEMAPGVIQSHDDSPGNPWYEERGVPVFLGAMVLFIDEAGSAFAVDPDPCIWLPWKESVALFHADLDRLEGEFGLRRVELAVTTHYHADHFEHIGALRERYGTRLLAPPDVAAVMAHPERYPGYPCRIPWYGLPYSSVTVDETVAYNAPIRWRETVVTPVRVPGHCWAHAGYGVEWRGRRIFCSGDSLQYGTGLICVPLPTPYNDTAWPDRGWGAGYRAIREWRPDLVLGGHTHAFGHNADEVEAILDDFLACYAESETLARAMLHDGDLRRAMTPPGFDEMRP